ncbi:hypothetical protein PWT90_00656 [Aphanocladium album]|nr:hypothetical protein PWT90_00656 [Aphanocladium album]
MAAKGFISYWWLPIISALVWVGILLGLLLHWLIDDHGQPYPYQNQDVKVVYISNVGAGTLKPLFIAGSCVVCLFLDLSMLAARWLRHRGRLVPNSTTGEKVLAVLTIFFAVVGTAGLILLSIFDTKNHKRLHYLFLLFFLAGYMLSAICTCWEYQRLGISMWPLLTTGRRRNFVANESIAEHREHRDLRTSFWAKLAVVLVEVSLAIAFIATNFTNKDEVAAILEWVVAFLFTFFILSFVIDLYPAVATKSHAARYDKRSPHEMEEASGATTPRRYNGNAPNATGAF